MKQSSTLPQASQQQPKRKQPQPVKQDVTSQKSSKIKSAYPQAQSQHSLHQSQQQQSSRRSYLSQGSHGGSQQRIETHQSITNDIVQTEDDDQTLSVMTLGVNFLAHQHGASTQQSSNYYHQISLESNSESAESPSSDPLGVAQLRHSKQYSMQQSISATTTGGGATVAERVESRTRVILQEAELTSVPGIVMEFRSWLQELDLSRNRLQANIFNEITTLVQLRVLRLDRNAIAHLPEEIAFLKNLNVLSLSHNRLKSLPRTLQTLSKLKSIDLKNNAIEAIGAEVYQLKNLTDLDLSSNCFVSLPIKACLLLLPGLHRFSLDWFKYTLPSLPSMLIRPTHSDIFQAITSFAEQKQKAYGGARTANASVNGSKISFSDFFVFFSTAEWFKTNLNDKSSRDTLIFSQSCLAIEADDSGALAGLLGLQKDVLNITDAFENTLLMKAISSKKTKCLSVLIDAFPSDPSKGGHRIGGPLMLAVQQMNSQIVEKLLRVLHADPNVQDEEGQSPLHHIFTVFLNSECRAGDDNVTDEARTVASLLLEYGANPNVRNLDKWTPLHVAVRKNQRAAVEFAKEYNARIIAERTPKNQKMNFDGIDSNSDTRRTRSDQQSQQQNKSDGSTGTFKTGGGKQVKNGESQKRLFKFDKKGGLNKWTPMHIAASQGNFTILEILFEAGANPFEITHLGQTPRKIALQSLVLLKLLKKLEERWSNEQISDSRSDARCSIEFEQERRTHGISTDIQGFMADTQNRSELFLKDLEDFKFLNQQVSSTHPQAILPQIPNTDDTNNRVLSQQYASISSVGTVKPERMSMALPQLTCDGTNCDDNMDDIDELSGRLLQLQHSNMELEEGEVEERIGKTTHSNALRQGVGAHAFLEFKGIDSRSNNSMSYKNQIGGGMLFGNYNYAMESELESAELSPIGEEFSEVRWLDNDARFNEELLVLQKKLLESKKQQRPFEEICLGFGILKLLHIRLCVPQHTRFVCEAAASALLPRSIHLMNEFLDASRIRSASTAIPAVLQLVLKHAILEFESLKDIRLTNPINYAAFNRFGLQVRRRNTVAAIIIAARESLSNINCACEFDTNIPFGSHIGSAFLSPKATSSSSTSATASTFSNLNRTAATAITIAKSSVDREYETSITAGNEAGNTYFQYHTVQSLLFDRLNANSSNQYHTIGSPNYFYKQQLNAAEALSITNRAQIQSYSLAQQQSSVNQQLLQQNQKQHEQNVKQSQSNHVSPLRELQSNGISRDRGDLTWDVTRSIKGVVPATAVTGSMMDAEIPLKPINNGEIYLKQSMNSVVGYDTSQMMMKIERILTFKTPENLTAEDEEAAMNSNRGGGGTERLQVQSNSKQINSSGTSNMWLLNHANITVRDHQRSQQIESSQQSEQIPSMQFRESWKQLETEDGGSVYTNTGAISARMPSVPSLPSLYNNMSVSGNDTKYSPAVAALSSSTARTYDSRTKSTYAPNFLAQGWYGNRKTPSMNEYRSIGEENLAEGDDDEPNGSQKRSTRSTYNKSEIH